jgi:hypothetical protein
MKVPTWILQVLLTAALAGEGWTLHAVIDLGNKQAAQGADLADIKALLSSQNQITKIERKNNE